MGTARFGLIVMLMGCTVGAEAPDPDAGPPAVCGDGVLAAGEELCDDGDEEPGDGCDGACLLEAGWECPVPGLDCRPERCGDNIVAGVDGIGEGCDDGGTANFDGCSATCTVEPGWVCEPDTGCRQTVCGDGITEGDESCDDANDDPFDGCGDCVVLPFCTRGACPSECGDGLVFPGEECDDGNLLPADGCSPTCTVETGWACENAIEDPDDGLTVPVIFRDFILRPAAGSAAFAHLDFTDTLATTGVSEGIVADRLGDDGLPVYTGRCTKGSADPEACQGVGASVWQTHGAELFDQWYGGGELAIETITELRLTESRARPGTFVFVGPATGFFPLDDTGWVASGDELSAPGCATPHNFGFTSEVRYWFTFEGGERFTFGGDDDVWVFVGGALALDLGGLHPRLESTITLQEDGAATCTGACVEARRELGLEVGQIYEIALFHAERRGCESNFRIDLTGFNRSSSLCAGVCGDGILVPGEECDDGNDIDSDSCSNACRFVIF
jgi:fibro-slime domain-containing protein